MNTENLLLSYIFNELNDIFVQEIEAHFIGCL